MRLKQRIGLAHRGHRLLKDKQDELVRRFLPLIAESWRLRKEVEGQLRALSEQFILVESLIGRKFLRQALMAPLMKSALEVSLIGLLNLRLPGYEVKFTGRIFSYSSVEFPQGLDQVLAGYQEVMEKLIKLAHLEKAIQLIAEEIERTRRRVNALEHILIPNLLETIKYIGLKLSERERESLTRLMKIKEIIRAH